MSEDSVVRWGDSLNRLLSWGPVILGLGLALEATWLRISLGHWPRVYRDQPSDVFSGVLEVTTIVAFLLVAWGAPAWLLSLHAVARRHGRRIAGKRALLFLGTLAILMVIARLNVLGFPEWWMD